MDDEVERQKNARKLGMVWRLGDETDIELKRDKQEMKRDGCIIEKPKRQMERCRAGYIAGRLKCNTWRI